MPEILGGKALEESKGLGSGALERKPERLEGGALLRSRAPGGKLGELESWALGEKPERLEGGALGGSKAAGGKLEELVGGAREGNLGEVEGRARVIEGGVGRWQGQTHARRTGRRKVTRRGRVRQA